MMILSHLLVFALLYAAVSAEGCPENGAGGAGGGGVGAGLSGAAGRMCPVDRDTTGGWYTKYNNFDAKSIADNARLLKGYASCLLIEGPCTDTGRDFKRVIQYAVRTKCIKCSENQKEVVRIIARAIRDKLPEEWSRLLEKQDPDNIYRNDFFQFMEVPSGTEKPNSTQEPKGTEEPERRQEEEKGVKAVPAAVVQ